MDKYRRVIKKDSAPTAEDEVRVTAKGRIAAYVNYGSGLFNEKNLDKFTIKATGTALATAVTVAEVLKRRFKGLHQITKLHSVEIEDEWEPTEEGLEVVKQIRNVSCIEILLSKTELDTTDKGYQEPLPESEVKELSPEELNRGGRRQKGEGRSSKGKGKGKGKGKNNKGKGKGKGKGKKGEKGKGKGKGKKKSDDDE